MGAVLNLLNLLNFLNLVRKNTGNRTKGCRDSSRLSKDRSCMCRNNDGSV
jgi:hypothetical protein